MKSKRRLAIAGIVVGALLTAAPLFGVAGTIVGMIRAFNTLGSSGIGDPKALGDSIGVTLFSTVAGLLLCPVGIIVLTLSLIFLSRLRRTTPPPLPPPFESANCTSSDED